MVIGIDELIKVIQETRIKNWEVRTQTGESNTTQMRTFDNQSQDEKLELTRSVMSNNYGKFHLIGYDSPTQAKGRMDIEFMIRQDSSDVAPSQRAIVGSLPSMEGYTKDSEVSKMIENVQLRYELNGVKSELDSLKKEKKELESPVNEFMRNLAPIVGAVATNLLQGKATPTAIGELGTEHTQPSQQENPDDEALEAEVNEAIRRWHEVDSDCLTLICKIADLAETDPQTYNMAKTMLMSR